MGKKKVAIQSDTEALKQQDTVDVAAKTAVVKKSKRLESGRVYVSASYNNTVVTVTDERGNVVAWATAGSLGFSGPKKATPFAASKIIAVIAEKVKNYGLTNVEVLVRGIGGGRDSAIRSLINHGFNLTSIRDVTPVPHNGPKPPKARRV